MSPLSVYCVVSLGILYSLANAAVFKNNRPKDFVLVTTKAPVSNLNNETSTPKIVHRERKLTRRERCCHLGRQVAKIGETCTYSTNIDHIVPNSHYHQMKTAVWMRRGQPINRRLLQKCKPFKAFYEKCCHYEYSLITEDLLRAKRKIKQYLKEIRRYEAKVEEGSTDGEQGGLPEEQQSTNNRKKYNS